jgi:prevent-host-death family protein
MQYVSSTDARNNMTKAIDMAQREPVVVQKQGRDVAVILSPQDFARITQDNLEDFFTFCKTIGRKAKAKGLTEAKLDAMLNDAD